MSLLEDLQPERPTALRRAVQAGNHSRLLTTFAQSWIYAPRTDDGTTYRRVERSGQAFIPVYDTYASMMQREAGGPEADVEHTQTIGRHLRAALSSDVGILLITGTDEECLVTYPTVQPVPPADPR